MSRAHTGALPPPVRNPCAPTVPSAVMWWDGGERAITAREKALIEEHSPSSFAIPLIPAPTPGARWAADGQPDPHSRQYECERSALTLGHYTDDELANAVFLHGNEQPSMAALAAGKALPGIAYLTAAKDRIRWLSRSLSNVIASRQPAGQERVAWASTGATGHKVVAMPGLHKLPYGDYDLYAAPPAQGIDLGQLKVEVQRLRKRTDPVLGEKAMYVRLDAVLALLDERDEAPGVDRG